MDTRSVTIRAALFGNDKSTGTMDGAVYALYNGNKGYIPMPFPNRLKTRFFETMAYLLSVVPGAIRLDPVDGTAGRCRRDCQSRNHRHYADQIGNASIKGDMIEGGGNKLIKCSLTFPDVIAAGDGTQKITVLAAFSGEKQ